MLPGLVPLFCHFALFIIALIERLKNQLLRYVFHDIVVFTITYINTSRCKFKRYRFDEIKIMVKLI